MKRLPLGIQTFSKMIEDDCYYVDKTGFIPKLFQLGTYFFLSRPRRFGKSSFLDTLREAVEGNKKLFKGLYLEKNWDWSKKYPVIKISFGGGQTIHLDNLKLMMGDMFLAFEREFQLKLESSSPAGKFKELIEILYKREKQKVVILVDEYDKPILDIIEKEELALLVRDELKNLYSVIKDSDQYIKFVFITGVSKFSKVNLFSGLNNLTDITLDPEFASICGYTQEELKVFQDLLADVSLSDLKEWYNGYNFRGEKIYNPYDVLNYLKNKEFKNYWFETGTPSFLIKLIEKRKFPIPDLEKIELTETSLNSFDVGSIELEALLFQTGYLTIQEIERLGDMIIYHLRYPNKEVKSSLTDSILKFLANTSSTDKEKNKSNLFKLLHKGDVEGLKNLFYAFFASIPYNWYTNNTIANYEGYYASVFYTYFTATGIEVYVEDATNLGRIDLVAILNHRCYVLEFKVNEMTGVGKAITQIKEKKYHEKYVGYASTHLYSGTVGEIYLIGVEFNKSDRNITAFDWEKV